MSTGKLSTGKMWGWTIAGTAFLAAGGVAAGLYWFTSVLGSLGNPPSNAPANAGEGRTPEQRTFEPTGYQQPGNTQAVSEQPELQQPAQPVSQRPEQKAQLLAPPVSGTWEATPIAAQGRALGRAGVDLEQGLQSVQAAISNCYSKPGQSGYAGRRVLAVANPEGDDTGSTVVVLQVEADRGELRIDAAPVEIRSGASDATLACVQDKLRNVKVPSDAHPPAYRFRLRYRVAP